MIKLAAALWSLRPPWLIVLLVFVLGPAHGQSSALAECTQTFYRGDYGITVQLAEKHLRQYPKDVPVRILLARAELAQGKLRQALRSCRKHWLLTVAISTPFITCLLFPGNFLKESISVYSR